MKALIGGLLAVLFISSSLSVQATDAVRAAVQRLQPEAENISIRPSPIEGISEVAMGLQVLYVSNDGAFALAGPMIALDEGINLTEQRLAASRATLLREAEADLFHFPAEEIKHRVTVFTDIDCPHCRRLHNELPAMQAAGIDVSYVLLPRAGARSASYRKSVNAACAENPEASITAAMAGQQPQPADCEHPIDDHMALSRSLNVRSTPSIVLDDGQLVLGYHTADGLLKAIEQRQRSQ